MIFYLGTCKNLLKFVSNFAIQVDGCATNMNSNQQQQRYVAALHLI